jgi:hypothetical protein
MVNKNKAVSVLETPTRRNQRPAMTAGLADHVWGIAELLDAATHC